MAHIIAASDAGPRADALVRPVDRGAYENIILLCPTCHAIVDKAPQDYPDDLLRRWKANHRDKVRAAFGVVECAERPLARAAIEPVLEENKAIFDMYGPIGDHHLDPESEVAEVWRRKVIGRILPNNRRLLAMADANRQLLTPCERQVLERFWQHVDDLEARHIGGGRPMLGSQFPAAMAGLFGDGASDPGDE